MLTDEQLRQKLECLVAAGITVVAYQETPSFISIDVRIPGDHTIGASWGSTVGDALEQTLSVAEHNLRTYLDAVTS